MGDIHVGTVAERMEILMGEIRALGRLPRRRPGLGDEYHLAGRLHIAKYRNLLSESQLAELAEFERALAEFERSAVAERMDSLMAEIRALGYLPRMRANLREEYALAVRLKWARQLRQLSGSQHAELADMERRVGGVVGSAAAARMESLMAEIRALGHLPRLRKNLGDEYALAVRLRRARPGLSESHLAELQEIALANSLHASKRQRLLSQGGC